MDTYIEDLTRLTCDYATKNKQIDHKFIDKLADIVVNGEELNEYVKNVKIKNYIGDSTSNYQPESGIIEINLKALHKEFLKLCIHDYSISETKKDLKNAFLLNNPKILDLKQL